MWSASMMSASTVRSRVQARANMSAWINDRRSPAYMPHFRQMACSETPSSKRSRGPSHQCMVKTSISTSGPARRRSNWWKRTSFPPLK